LDKAHEIARSVELGIERSIPRIRQVTVHLEPLRPEIAEGQIVEDKQVSDTIRSVIKRYPDVLEISAIATYRAKGTLHINVHCIFRGDEPISEVHEIISKIEESLRNKFDNSIVTIHPEPSAS
ncbi:MAG: cation transporter dimerization domain-containing protein, partial [Candidatus Bathyarchaeia archaeon]